jgi:hypothetical protein
MTVAIRRDIVSVSDIETVYEIREDESPVSESSFRYQPVDAVTELLTAVSSFTVDRR